MTNRFIELPGMREVYMATLTQINPEYKSISIAHEVVSEGGKTLRMSGWPAIDPQGIIGKGDMRVQTLQSMEYVHLRLSSAGATWDDIVYGGATRFPPAPSSSRSTARPAAPPA